MNNKSFAKSLSSVKQKKHKAGADDRNPPSQDCSSHMGIYGFTLRSVSMFGLQAASCVLWSGICIRWLADAFSLFSPSMTYGCCTTSCFWSFLEVCMKPTCLESLNDGWGRFVRTFCENVFVEMTLEFVLTRMSFLLAINNNFQTALFQMVLHVNGLRILWRRTFVFWTGICGWLECSCNMCNAS